MKLRLLVAAIAVAGFLTQTPRASADSLGTLTLTFDSAPNGNGLNNGGPFHWTQTAPLNSNFNSAITTYCIDIYGTVQSGSFLADTDLTVASKPANGGIDASKVTAINTLFDHFYNSSFATATTQAAFQLALWELIYDGAASPNLLTGTIRGSGAVGSLAQTMLTGVYTGTAHDLANARLAVLVADTTKPPNQDQITVIPKAVPAPPAVLLAGIGVLALFGRSRLTRKPTVA